MHRCLEIHDIKNLIFDHSDLSELPGLATICHGFTDVALDRLWRRQNDMGNLIQVMPPSLWMVVPGYSAPAITDEEQEEEEADPTLVSKTIVFMRELEEGDWARFEYYSYRIHQLGVSPIEHGLPFTIADDVIVTLATYRPMRDLLPNLRYIRLDLEKYINTGKSIALAQCLLGSTMKLVSLDIPSELSEQVLLNLFSSFSRLCPNIEELRLTWVDNQPPSQHVERLKKLVGSLKKLHVFNVVPAIPMPLSELATLPLRSLGIVKVSSALDLFEFTTSTNRFVYLHELVLEVEGWDSAAGILSMMWCPFTSLEITNISRALGRPHALANFIKFLSRHPSSASFTHLTLHEPLEASQPGGRFVSAVSQLFRPLFALTNLQYIQLRFRTLSDLDDAWLLDAANAWPYLESLSLSGLHAPSRLTLAGLVPLVKHCPHLHSLHISFIAMPFEPALLAGSRNLNVSEISLPMSPLTDPMKVARCLVLMFPRLERVSGWTEYVTWKKVNEWLHESSYE